MKKKIVCMVLGTLAVAACGGIGPETSVDSYEPVASTEQKFGPYGEGLLGPVSEESGKSSGLCGASSGLGVVQARCVGSYCDDMYLYCKALPFNWAANPAVPVWGTTSAGSYWTGYISEEAPNNTISCGSGQNITGAIDGIRATGSHADNISVHCAPFTRMPNWINCRWTPFFSEEQGTQEFGTDEIAVGVRCSGRYCDNMSYQVCRDTCTYCSVNSQCGGGTNYCVNGCCVVG